MIHLCISLLFMFLLEVQCHTTFNASESRNSQVLVSNYSFAIDYENDQFLLDGEPFRYVSGSFHYFRTPRQFWRDRLRKMRIAGLNAVSTYVEWSTHQPEMDVWNWQGDADIIEFIKMVQEEDLLLLLRPGPYICAERDFGGFPYWLLNVVPKGKLRTDNASYMEFVEIYLRNLFQRIKPYLRGNGGPIIMVQVENEYGSYKACNKPYITRLVNIFNKYVEDKAVLYTTDGWYYDMLKCGTIPGAYATVDFGPKVNPREAFSFMRRFSPKGPLVNSEYYPGWLTHWNESLQTVPSDRVAKTLTEMLALNASINFYMFYGGTNFGFTSGANGGGADTFLPQITSYDYDAPLTEAGDITPKYLVLRDIIGNFLPLPNTPIPQNKMKGSYRRVTLNSMLGLFEEEGRKLFGTKKYRAIFPPTLEDLNLPSYLLLYESQVLNSTGNNTVLRSKVADRAIVYANNLKVGILSRSEKKYSLPINTYDTLNLQILLESQGHLNYGNFISDYKGIYNVTFGDRAISPWFCTGFRLQNVSALQYMFRSLDVTGILHNGPVFLKGYFDITEEPRDTYLDTSGWSKGVAYINGYNLGRYWPSVGPQITLYVPSVYLRTGLNELIVLEFEHIPDNPHMSFQNYPKFNIY